MQAPAPHSSTVKIQLQTANTSYVSFIADTFKIHNGTTSFSPFIVENGQVKIKSAAIGNLTLGNFSDIPDELKQVTAVYADGINGANASTTKGSKNFVAWYNGTSIWTPSIGVGSCLLYTSPSPRD